MSQSFLFAAALGLTDPWIIKSVEFNAEEKRLDIHIDFSRGAKFSIDSDGPKFPVHDTKEKVWRHLNFFEHDCYLHCRTPRVKSDDGKVTLCNPPWSGRSKGFTLLMEAFLLQLVTAMPVAQVSKLCKISDDKLWRVIDMYVEQTRMNEDFSDVEKIGIDETSRSKGHDYITLFVDLDKRKTLFITEGKDSSTVSAFAIDLQAHGGHPDDIKLTTIDMSPAFIKGIKSTFKNSQIVFDRFHIMKNVNDGVNKVRMVEAKDEDILKKARYVVLKNRENLTKIQKEKLKEIEGAGYKLKTYRAMRMRELMQDIYNANGLDDFKNRLKTVIYWMTHSKLKPMIDVGHTLINHRNGIISWFETKLSNAILEGLNSLIQSAKSKARGYRTIKNMKLIAYLITGKLNFSKINPFIKPT